jgi:adenylate kinase family enzyme
MKNILSAFLLFITLSSQAQDGQAPATARPAVHLTASQWKALDGVFQSSGANNDLNVRFTSKDTVLVAKLLWNNQEVHLLPQSELVFISKESLEGGPVTITFHKDSAGAINQVKIGNNNAVWKRNDNYKEIVKVEMQHTPDQLKPFEGLYLLKNTDFRFIRFTVKGNTLVLRQEWNGNEISFLPEAPLDFYTHDAPGFTLQFTKEPDGTISQVLAFKHDIWTRVKQPNLTMAILKTYEGKYQSADDPDNQITLTAKDNGLVVTQLWDKKTIVIQPWTETYFDNDDRSCSVHIIKKDGIVKGIVLLDTNTFNKLPD